MIPASVISPTLRLVRFGGFGRMEGNYLPRLRLARIHLLSDDMVAALREITGSAMANMNAPNVYLPFSSLEWLVFSEPKASAASA